MLGTLENQLSSGLPYKRKIALLLLLKDPFLACPGEWLAEGTDCRKVEELLENLISGLVENIHYLVSRTKNRWVSDTASKAVKKQGTFSNRFSENFAKLSRHPVTGIPLLFAFLILSYFIVVHVAGFIEGFLSSLIADPIIAYLDALLPAGLFQDFLIGEYGILTLGIFNAVFTVLPVLSVFFILFGLMEDMGYLPNLSILVRRLFSKLGLSGKAIMPIVLCFGCKTMATLTTRSIASKKERTIAIFLIAFGIPCSAQMGLNMAIL